MTERTWVVENKWRCTSCGSENLGRHMECQNCRNPKDSSETDDTSKATSAPAVSDPELLRLANQGANWVCEYCGGQVRNEFGKCVKNCGAPRAEPQIDEELTRRAAKYAAEEKEPLQVSSPRRSHRPKPPPTTVPGPGVPLYPKRPFKVAPFVWWVGGGLALVGSLVWLLTWLLMPWEVEARVTRIAWEFRTDLHQKTLEHSEGWGHPYDSFNVSCDRRLKTHRDCNPYQCNPHSENYECNCSSYECNCTTECRDQKNGFSKCSNKCRTCRSCNTCQRTVYSTCYERCPVYDDWCSYDYYDWPVVKSLTTNGLAHDEHWPDLEAQGPDQRVDKHTKFEVGFEAWTDASKSWTYAPADFLEFKQFDSAARWHLSVNRVGSVTPLHRTAEK